MQDIEYQNLIPIEKGDRHSSDDERIRAIAAPLLKWYQENRRILPWREDPTPYHVWISEIMLQQTRVEAVKAYYERFTKALPDIEALAKVEDDELMKLWQGLGYYSRARNLKKAAIAAMQDHGGNLPADHEKLLELPGIGPYTAGAIASIAFGIKRPAVDGNVFRVISRLLEDRSPIDQPAFRKKVEELLLRTMPDNIDKEVCDGGKHNLAGDFNQALMEIGALVCVPNGAPHCDVCPLNGLCLAYRHGSYDEIPVKSPKKARKIEEKTVFLIAKDGKYAVSKRPDHGLLAGLYEFPNMEGSLDESQIREILEKTFKVKMQDTVNAIEFLGEARHIFTHVEWHMRNYRIKAENLVASETLYLTEGREFLEHLAIPSAYAKLLKILENEVAENPI